MRKAGVRLYPFASGLVLGVTSGVVASFAIPFERGLSPTEIAPPISTAETGMDSPSDQPITFVSADSNSQAWDGANEITTAASSSSDDARFLPSIAPLRDAMMVPSTKGRMEFFTRLQDLEPEEAPQMLDVFRELAQNGYKVAEYEPFFWERWAELDGKNVAAMIFERDKRFKETRLSKLTIATWARNEPEAAMNWLFEQEDIPIRDGMTKGLIEGMAVADPDLAQEFLSSGRLNSDQIAHGFNQIARQKLIQEGIDSVGQWYAEIPEDDPYFSVATNAAVQMYAKASFGEALEWANGLEGSPDSVNQARGMLHAKLSSARPDGLIHFLGSDPNATEIIGVESLASRAIDRWLQTTPYAMGTWLQENDDLPNYDMIVEPFVEKIALEDLHAAKAWAETIRDPGVRQRSLERLGLEP